MISYRTHFEKEEILITCLDAVAIEVNKCTDKSLLRLLLIRNSTIHYPNHSLEIILKYWLSLLRVALIKGFL